MLEDKSYLFIVLTLILFSKTTFLPCNPVGWRCDLREILNRVGGWGLCRHNDRPHQHRVFSNDPVNAFVCNVLGHLHEHSNRPFFFFYLCAPRLERCSPRTAFSNDINNGFLMTPATNGPSASPSTGNKRTAPGSPQSPKKRPKNSAGENGEAGDEETPSPSLPETSPDGWKDMSQYKSFLCMLPS